MAKRVQRRRGTTAEHGSFTGAVGEITVDTTKDTVAVHDGSQAGGFPLAREDMNNVTNRVGVQQLACNEGTNGQVLSTNGSGTLSFSTVDATTAAVGGDLSGTVGNAQIVANAVGNTEIANGAINTVKVEDGSLSTAKLASNSVTTVKINDGAVTTAKIAASQVQSSHILDGTIVAGDIASNAVTSIKILDGNITTAKLATNAVTANQIADNAVTVDQINANAVTTIKIAANAVTSAEIAANAITNGKIADGTIVNVDIANTTITGAKLATTTLASLNAYDIAFTAGFDKDMVKENVASATYGELVMARAGTIIGEAGYIDTAPTGAVVTIDIQKNGTAAYGSGQYPTFAINANSLTAGTLIGSGSGVPFVSGDRITFKIVGIGSSEPGEGLRFTLKCKLTE